MVESRGDLLIQIHVMTPQNITHQETELFKKLREIEKTREQALFKNDTLN